MAKLTLTDLASLANETSAINAINNNNAAIETALENTLSRDGSVPNEMEASLDMNSNRILNLPAPSAGTEPARKVDLDTLEVDLENQINDLESTVGTLSGELNTKIAEANDYASQASISATAASTYATNASNSAIAAALSSASAASALDNFDDRYLGSKSSDPATDNDGDALVVGSLYYNSVNKEMMVYDGANWLAAVAGDAVATVFGRTGTVTAQGGDYTATQITNTPSGNIAATTVQAAINELDSEKAATSHTHDDRYYTESEVTTLLSGKSDTNHNHNGVYEPVDADILRADTADNLTAGYTATEYNAGTKSTGTFTPDPANGNFQKAVNGGAHTLAPPASTCTMVIQYTNNASAGAITTSGFTTVTGDSLTTVDGDDFFFFITRVNGFTNLHVQALQ